MLKIRKIEFIDHPILKNLQLDFCNQNGKAVDTIIFAGENGTGKSTIINELYSLVTSNVRSNLKVTVDNNNKISTLLYKNDSLGNNAINHVIVNDQSTMYLRSSEFIAEYPFSGIFSDVDINFRSGYIGTVTSNELDNNTQSRRSSDSLPTEINQLLVDIQALDDSDIAFEARNNPDLKYKDLNAEERIPRFTNAFNYMFDNMTYSRVVNQDGQKKILFKNNNGIDIPIDQLSSGEKQIVYRGGFLLRDVNALNGVFVFIDEPEISLHPSWQIKIMDYYKKMFTDSNGRQTSQIFAATHSPFIIHNENRINDKVIVLTRNNQGNIIVADKPSYYKCSSQEVIEDAFHIDSFLTDIPIVLLEGRTDEMYFNRALEVYKLEVPFQFKWVGHFDANGKEENTGSSGLDRACSVLRNDAFATKVICLYDCDKQKKQNNKNNVIEMSMKQYENDKGISIGIENALVFGNIDIEPYKKQRKEVDGYCIERLIPAFQKMECCQHICSLDDETLKEVFVNLKEVIESIMKLITEEHKNKYVDV